MNTTLGRASWLEDGSLFTEHLGTPLVSTPEDISLDDVMSMVDELRSCHEAAVPSRVAGLGGWSDRNRASVIRRLGAENPLAKFALGILDQRMPSSAEPWGLCHTDPHLGNWVVDGGRLVLVDWESALCAPHDVDLGSLARLFFCAGRMDVVAFLEDVSLDREFFWWAARQKAALNLSFVAVKHGEEAAWERACLIADLVDYSA